MDSGLQDVKITGFKSDDTNEKENQVYEKNTEPYNNKRQDWLAGSPQHDFWAFAVIIVQVLIS